MENKLQSQKQLAREQTTWQPMNSRETKSQKQKGSSLLFYINILLLLIVLGLGIYILREEGYFKQKQEEKEEEVARDDNIEIEEAGNTIFTGKYLKASLPNGWGIREYEDGEENEMIPEGVDFSGLTGIEISNRDKSIMRLEMLDGVGSVGCGAIVLFKDSPENFEEEMKASNKVIGLEGKVIDYTNTEYSETILFGMKVRRVEKRVFYDTEAKTEAFEAQCEGSWIVLDKLDAISPTSLFQLTISQDATAEELSMLDSILKELELK